MLQKIALISFILCCFACKNGKNSVKTGKSYYPSGKIKQVYKYLNSCDTCLFDTFYSYYENGKFESKIVYDSSGNETGTAKFYYPNGILKGTINYIKDIAQGEQIRYDSLGNLNSKGFNFNGINVGDEYFYKNNKVWTYQFFDFHRNLFTSVEYDENGNITKQEGDRGFLDSIKVEPIQNGFNLFKIFILQPNPPRTSNKLIANYYDKQGKIIDFDSLNTTGIPLIHFQKKFKSNFSKLTLIDTQYDSILKKSFTWIYNNNMEYAPK